jgi:hypothetical protein
MADVLTHRPFPGLVQQDYEDVVIRNTKQQDMLNLREYSRQPNTC